MTPRLLPVLLASLAVGCASLATDAPPPPGPYEALDAAQPTMPALIARFAADRALLERRFDAPMSEASRARRADFLAAWRAALDAVAFDRLDLDGRIDWVLLRNALDADAATLADEARRDAEVAPLLPFAPTIAALHDARRALADVDPEAAAATVAALGREAKALREGLDALPPEERPAPTVARRAALRLAELRASLRAWRDFSTGYDPLFTWWVEAPWTAADAELGAYATAIRTTLAGMTGDDDDETIIGDPVGRERLLELLAREFVPYTPEELVAIGEREYAWCLARMLEASRELGFGDDWHAALEHVKGLHVAPGDQPALVRDLARTAIGYLAEHDLVTVPPLAAEGWRMAMMSPERQKVAPYFLGGETIVVSFPTAAMEHEDKLMSMRSNNPHFAWATVHHELIPGHHLQGFMLDRHRPYRQLFTTPFWIEGWALHWELLLWDRGFFRGPEDRVGMLFWRMHRCARIRFSLAFHLGTLSPAECVEMLVQDVGHERSAAEAEVRRSVSGDYGPLYQAAYMLGGLQMRALRTELVESGRMTDRDFHDAILREGPIPIEILRAKLRGEAPTRDFGTSWRFADSN